MKKIFILDFLTDTAELSDVKLSKERIERCSLIKDTVEKQKFIYSEKAVLQILKKYYAVKNPAICGKSAEKPYLKCGKNISFSKSYADNMICLGFEQNGNIGVDIEKIRKSENSVINFFFTDSEKDYIEKSENKDLAFTLIWTRKECYIKTLGEGLSCRFDLIDVSPCGELGKGQLMFEENTEVEGLYINSYIWKDFIISVSSDVNDAFPQIKYGW